jgi:hypothetical protein
VAVIFTVVYCLTILYRDMRRTVDNSRKNRIKYIFWGIGFSGLLLAFTILPVSGIPLYPLGNFSFIPAIVLAFGVLKYDLLDFGLLFRRGTVYFLLTGILTVLYVLIIFLFHSLFLSGGGDPFALSLILAVVIVLLFNPLRGWVQRLIDRLFFRGRYDYRQLLREISGRMASLLNLSQIRELLIGAITDALQVEKAILVMAEGDRFCLYDEQTADGAGVELPHKEIAPLSGYLERERMPLSLHESERRLRSEA